MATYTLAAVTFSAAQETGFDRKLFILNQERARNGQAPVTKQQYIDGVIQRFPAEWLGEFRDDFKERCGVAIASASVANLQTVATTLGVDINPYD